MNLIEDVVEKTQLVQRPTMKFVATKPVSCRGLREDEMRWRPVFPAHANPGDPNGPA